jgi:glycoprotein 3-alpha-L-fucosyltransferase
MLTKFHHFQYPKLIYLCCRSDSTIVAPYERWQYYNENVRGLDLNKNYGANKTKAVAWFVSNCGARNGRLDYAKELQKYIQVMMHSKLP